MNGVTAVTFMTTSLARARVARAYGLRAPMSRGLSGGVAPEAQQAHAGVVDQAHPLV
jgi:hypothetical protein